MSIEQHVLATISKALFFSALLCFENIYTYIDNPSFFFKDYLGEILITWNMGITLYEAKIVKYFMHVMPHSFLLYFSRQFPFSISKNIETFSSNI